MSKESPGEAGEVNCESRGGGQEEWDHDGLVACSYVSSVAAEA